MTPKPSFNLSQRLINLYDELESLSHQQNTLVEQGKLVNFLAIQAIENKKEQFKNQINILLDILFPE